MSVNMVRKRQKQDGKRGIEFMNNKQRMSNAITIALEYGQIDGAHHKMWVIDQMIRALTGDNYEDFIKKYYIDEDGGTSDWDCGIAP